MKANRLQARLPLGEAVPLDNNNRSLSMPGGNRQGWLVANDVAIKHVVQVGAAYTPWPTRGKKSVALIVGNGFVNSILPEVPTDHVLLVDKSSNVLRWQQRCGRILLQATDAQQYRRQVVADDDPLSKDLDQRARGHLHRRYRGRPWEQPEHRHPAADWLEGEAERLEELHFLSSPTRYAACQEDYKQKRPVLAQVDLTSDTGMTRLSDTLADHNLQITYTNLTNVHEWTDDAYGQYMQLLGSLPFHTDAFVGFSQLHNDLVVPGSDIWPVATWTTGLDNYAALTAEQMSGW